MIREIRSREFRDNMADELDRVQYDGQVLIITRRKPSAAIVPLSYLAERTAKEGICAFRLARFGREQPRAEVAADLRPLAADPGGTPIELPGGESAAIEFLLRELAALYTGDPLGKLADELAEQMAHRKYGQTLPPPISTS